MALILLIVARRSGSAVCAQPAVARAARMTGITNSFALFMTRKRLNPDKIELQSERRAKENRAPAALDSKAGCEPRRRDRALVHHATKTCALPWFRVEYLDTVQVNSPTGALS